MSFFSSSDVEARPVGVDMNAVMRQVYLWMTLGLVVSAGTAFAMAQSGLTAAFYRNPVLPLITVVAYFILAFALQPIIMRSQPSVGALFYLLFTAMLGITISSIFLMYRLQTIGYAFIATSATLATMSVIGYTTKLDMSRLG